MKRKNASLLNVPMGLGLVVLVVGVAIQLNQLPQFNMPQYSHMVQC